MDKGLMRQITMVDQYMHRGRGGGERIWLRAERPVEEWDKVKKTLISYLDKEQSPSSSQSAISFASSEPITIIKVWAEDHRRIFYSHTGLPNGYKLLIYLRNIFREGKPSSWFCRGLSICSPDDAAEFSVDKGRGMALGRTRKLLMKIFQNDFPFSQGVGRGLIQRPEVVEVLKWAFPNPPTFKAEITRDPITEVEKVWMEKVAGGEK